MLLIKPSILGESQSSTVAPFIYNTFPTSLGFLAGYLREYNGIVPTIVDEDLTPLDPARLQQLITADTGPRIIGFSLITIAAYRAYELARMVKEIDPTILTVLGGIHPTTLPDEALETGSVDVVVRGEGEETLSELVKRHEEGRDYGDIAGISHCIGGKTVHNPTRPLPDINSIPPFPYDLFSSTFASYRDFGTVISARGCPFDCVFCSQRAISGRKFRFVDNARVLDDIEVLITRYGQKKIWFMDDNFLVNKRRTYSLIDGIIERGFHKKAGFVAEMRGESVDLETLHKMKAANFQVASFGMETGSQRLLDLIDKGETVEDNIRAIEMAHEVGLGTSATFIFGLPTETRQERLATARLARRMPLDDARFNVVVPYPGTRLYETAKEAGRLNIKPGWTNFNVQAYMFGDDLPYLPDGTTAQELIRDTFMANLRFWARGKNVKAFLKAPVSGGMVLTLPERWYVNPKEIRKLMKLGMFINRRFLRIALARRGREAHRHSK